MYPRRQSEKKKFIDYKKYGKYIANYRIDNISNSGNELNNTRQPT